ncbi:hypothetical protein ACFFRR_006803 [Megaselia abdita]
MSDADENVPNPIQMTTPRSSLGSTSISSSSSSSSSSSRAVRETLDAWTNYLHAINSLCSAGYKLAQTISALEQWGNFNESNPTQSSFTNAWDDLGRASAVGTSTVKTHIVSVLQDFIYSSVLDQQENDQHQRTRDHNQQIILENAQTMINIQHQFCAASYDAFSSLLCCLICQAPVGFPHEPECAMINQKLSLPCELRSQTPSPHQKMETFRNTGMFGSGSTQASMEQVFPGNLEHTRGPSPHQEIRGPSPVSHTFLDNIRGPLPNPGHLLGMKVPFYRGSRSPLNFPLFPLNGQRRWSEAAAGEVRSGEHIIDAETQMRRWSMPWEVTKTDKNTVTWHQTRIMPISKLARPISSKANSDRSQSTTPDSIWQSENQDGIAEAIQLLSIRPQSYKLTTQQSFPTFIEEPVGILK